MGVVIKLVVFLCLLWAAFGAFKTVFESPLLKPYCGIFLIAGLIGLLGAIIEWLFNAGGDYLFIVAKGLAILGAAGLCVQLIIRVAKHFFSRP